MKRWLTPSAWMLGALAIFWITTFKIMDRDFWWHVKAGEIMFTTHRMIVTDPFAYARAGLPYLATHEWLAQIALYLVYHLGGSTGIILFRGIVACTALGLLSLLAERKRAAYAALAVWAVVITKGSYLERPQLFTFVFFSGFILLAFRFLDAASFKARLRICIAFVVLELLWLNMHGGAALVGGALVGFLLMQTLSRSLGKNERRENMPTLLLLLGTLCCMAVAFVLPPNGFGNITYLSQLLTDKTIVFIAEWQPREWPLYLKELWPFYALSIVALFTGGRHPVFNGLLLLATAYLSRQAFRHEILFVFASVATCFYQLDRGDVPERIGAWIARHRRTAWIAGTAGLLLLTHVAVARSYAFERQDNLFGYGQFDLARGAYDFVERENPKGNMFNTYGIGGYLIYRGYPNRKVFIDGRNVDYGFEYMARAYAAGLDREQWDDLSEAYHITYAIVDYDAIRESDSLPYAMVLDTHPDWAMAYLDDWVAVYLKKTPANAPIIARLGYEHVTATDIQFQRMPSQAPKDALKDELRRMQKDSPESIKATMALAGIALDEKRYADARLLAETARRARPDSPEPFAILAASYVQEERWQDAEEAYDEVIRLAGDNYPNMDTGFIAEITERAGHPWKAWFQRLGTAKKTTPTESSPATMTGAEMRPTPAGSVNPAADAAEFEAHAIALAEAGKTSEAEEAFLTSLTLNPGSPSTWNNLCALYLQLEQTPKAIDACGRAIGFDAEFGDAHYNLALAQYRAGSREQAEAEALLAQKFGRVSESEKLLLLIRKM